MEHLRHNVMAYNVFGDKYGGASYPVDDRSALRDTVKVLGQTRERAGG